MEVGDIIGVLCEIRPGPFSEESMITFETVDGPISRFVRRGELREESGRWFVRALVQAIRDDILEVRVRGSFFTTNGLASIPRKYAMAA